MSGLAGVRVRWYQGGYTGWVYGVGTREGNTGTPSHVLGERSHTSEAGPGRACRALEWVGVGARA